MSSPKPKVSVLITTYNHAPHIGQAIQSAVEQKTDFPYEILVGEDCSTDNTREIAVSWQTEYPEKVRCVLHERNLGGHGNFSTLLKQAKGQYVAWVEGDDYWTSPGKLQKQADFLDNHPEIALCFHPVTIVYEDEPGRKPDISNANQPPIVTVDNLCMGNYIHTASCMFRSGLVPELPGWIYGLPLGDWPLFLMIGKYGNIGFIDEVMAVYRIHQRGTWAKRPHVERMKATIRVAEACKKATGLKALAFGIDNFCKDLIRLSLESGDRKTARQYKLKRLLLRIRQPSLAFAQEKPQAKKGKKP
jgi:glycosyltransferase involved in cell wall biosynthesis